LSFANSEIASVGAAEVLCAIDFLLLAMAAVAVASEFGSVMVFRTEEGEDGGAIELSSRTSESKPIALSSRLVWGLEKVLGRNEGIRVPGKVRGRRCSR
jgi:hypothetical protein